MLQSGTTASGLQKIYEEGYLTCSTAVYYEGQGNEDEAMRCWKSAVQQIRHQYANGHFPDYRALSSSEKALSDSIRELEYQAQERIDLLAALKESRVHDPFKDPPKYSEASQMGYGASPSSTAGVVGGDYVNGYPYEEGSSSAAPQTPGSSGYIGGGTIPAITYNELSRPEVSRKPPPVPPRLSMNYSRNSSYERGGAEAGPSSGLAASAEGSSENVRNSLHRAPNSYTMADVDQVPQTEPPPPSRNVLSKRTSRSPNKDRQHTLRPTLRTAPSETPSSKSSKSSRISRLTSKPTAEQKGASKAATLAWTALGLSSYGKSESSSSRKASTSTTDSPSKSHPSSSMQMPQRKPLRDDSPSSQPAMQWDSNSRRLVPQRGTPDAANISPSRSSVDLGSAAADGRSSGEYGSNSARLQSLSLNAAASALNRSLQPPADGARPSRPNRSTSHQRPSIPSSASSASIERVIGDLSARPKSTGNARFPGSSGAPSYSSRGSRIEIRRNVHSSYSAVNSGAHTPNSLERNSASTTAPATTRRSAQKAKDKGTSRSAQEVSHLLADVQLEPSSSEDSDKLDESDKADKDSEEDPAQMPWKKRKQALLKSLPAGVDEDAAKNILNEIVIQGDVVRWGDIAGLEPAKKALREVVVYPFLRPDLFMGLREPATGMLLFGPPGTGKTMLARAVATESRSTFFSISASSLTSKYLGESEKLVRALFVLAKVLAPSIIFVDEIDSILSQRSGSGEHEATRRIKTEFLIQWSDLQRAAAGREDKDGSSSSKGDASRVLVLAATNLPWAIDEAARRRFVRRQYIPLPETETRAVHLRTLLGQQKHGLTEDDIQRLVDLTDGFSGSDITALAKDAAMGPLRSLGEALLMTKMDEIRPIELSDFVSSLVTIRPSVSKSGLKEYEDWAREFGERGG
ncbi:aaa family atpase [Ophiostoma piceae UAMH 11346]|uniref:Aaa family atpase n=1 Tax=Ophiostoma piceae (strain UAMH 11346) TaxID=1262450 RepID=S3CBN8_OPHP1|nr:aaa family atpase [Ophiostoma piceae UAMH 11346]